MRMSNGPYFGARRRMRRQFSNRSNLVWGRMFFAFLGTPLVFIFSLICGIHGLAVLFLIGGWFYLLYPKTSRTKKGSVRRRSATASRKVSGSVSETPGR
jgi:hypothetical protein